MNLSLFFSKLMYLNVNLFFFFFFGLLSNKVFKLIQLFIDANAGA